MNSQFYNLQANSTNVVQGAGETESYGQLYGATKKVHGAWKQNKQAGYEEVHS